MRRFLTPFGLLLALAACHMRREATSGKYRFKPCDKDRYVQVINSTAETYDVYLATSPTTRLYVGTVYPNSRIDLPIDPSITGGAPEVLPVAQVRRTAPRSTLGNQYATIVCR